MCKTSISLWFVCRLCRGSFGQVDAFIEHKKQKHFTQFQNTTSIVFQETEQRLQFPVITNCNADHQLQDVSNEPPIKIEVNDEDPVIPFSSEIIGEPNLCLLEPKSELITYENKAVSDNRNDFVDLEQPEQNPYVLLKRLTPYEIRNACVRNHHSRLLAFEQKDLWNNLEPFNMSSDVDSDSSIADLIQVDKSTENQTCRTVGNISTNDDLQFECKLCSKQVQSDAQLKSHVGICALYHKDRNRFCVTCNRKFSKTEKLKNHRLRFHGTEEEKLSLLKFKCHICPKQFREAIHLRFHVESHKKKKQKILQTKCSHPNCGKGFKTKSKLRRHKITHLVIKPFSCPFPSCYKTFAQKIHVEKHFMIHTGERPFKCTVDNCNRAYITSSGRLNHQRTAHRNV